VRDVFHRAATVIDIDPEANHRLGRVRLRYDDGKVVAFALVGLHIEVLPRESAPLP